jgi:hypothetical protein
MGNSLHTTSIHTLDDDSLLHVFYLHRPFLSGEDEGDVTRFIGGRYWIHGRWWYRLAHVCQRWRNIILGSASYLELSLVCTFGTPIADMLAHSPPFPLVIDYFGGLHNMSAEDEQGIIFALKQRERVIRVRLTAPVTSLQKFIVTMDEEYPILEYLIIEPPLDNSTILVFPETLQAPHLHLLRLGGFALPIGRRLLTTAVSLVTLFLTIHPSTYLHPNTLLQWISLMPQLETLIILWGFPIPNHDVERQLTHMPTIAPVTLPNLRCFRFHGVSTYLEALTHRITAPLLEKLDISFFNQLTFFVPRLLQSMNSTENLRFHTADVSLFNHKVEAVIYPHGDIEEVEMYSFAISVYCWHLDWQISSMTQISNSLSQIFSAVEHLTLQHEKHSRSSEEHNSVDRTEWRGLLSPFRNVKTLRIVVDGLVEELSRCLQLEDGEHPLELLPELQELTYYGSGNADDAFTSFIDARQNAGHPVALVRL